MTLSDAPANIRDMGLNEASPDRKAECGRCGAIVRVAMVGRHDRWHDWEDDLRQHVAALEDQGVDALVEWPVDDEPTDGAAPRFD